MSAYTFKIKCPNPTSHVVHDAALSKLCLFTYMFYGVGVYILDIYFLGFISLNNVCYIYGCIGYIYYMISL